jgi:hypothetical protein
MSEFSKLVEAVISNHNSIPRSFRLNPICTKCGQAKDRTEFSFRNDRKQLRSWCKVCSSNNTKEYYLTHERKRNPPNPVVKEFEARISVAISREGRALVKAAAKRDGVSASEKVRQYIEWGLENEE